jgi:hypothetical protein
MQWLRWQGLVWVLALVLTLSSVPAVSAATARSGSDLGPFAKCPLARASVEGCINAVVTGGSLTVGWASVPLTAPIVLQGGFESVSTGIAVVGASDGETLSAAPQPVPGLKGVLAVTATVELAGPASGRTEIGLNTSNLLTETGPALTLPVVIELDSRLLGDECTIGSSSDPVEITLTTGSSGSLQGSVGDFSSDESSGATTLKNAKLVDEGFAVGPVDGCFGSFSPIVDPFVNLALALSAASQQSAAVLEADLRTTPAEALRNGR